MDIKLGTGVIPPLVTPLNQDESIEYGGLGKVINHVIDGGVHAVFPMGSTGEFPRFSHSDRNRFITEAVQLVAGRVPVMAGVSDAGLRQVLRNVRNAEQAGADAVVVTLPYYFPIYNDDEAFAFFKAISEDTALPIMLYNIPSTCGASISLEVMERLFTFPNIIGIKDSSGDAERLQETLHRFKNRDRDYAVVVGAEELSYLGLSSGADGLVPSMANPFPKIFTELFAAACDGRLEYLLALCDEVNALNATHQYADAWLTALVWRKQAMAHLGLCHPYCTSPYLPVPEEADRRIRETVDQYQQRYGGRE